MIAVKVEYKLSAKDVSLLLATALEQGSRYWMEVAGRDQRVKPLNFANTEAADESFTHLSFPMNEGGSIRIIDLEESDDKKTVSYLLDLHRIQRGFRRMANDKTYAFRFQNIAKGDYDATDADVFLQFAVFGKVIYG